MSTLTDQDAKKSRIPTPRSKKQKLAVVSPAKNPGPPRCAFSSTPRTRSMKPLTYKPISSRTSVTQTRINSPKKEKPSPKPSQTSTNCSNSVLRRQRRAVSDQIFDSVMSQANSAGSLKDELDINQRFDSNEADKKSDGTVYFNQSTQEPVFIPKLIGVGDDGKSCFADNCVRVSIDKKLLVSIKTWAEKEKQNIDETLRRLSEKKNTILSRSTTEHKDNVFDLKDVNIPCVMFA
ncbi:uncharacterized protein LOC143449671 [Clavelina lepadiformis]|uniref:uncharacterized protein LOC143449671 n=1 Tax=Clavelina lepadiformis TaxID=159417 RepID=UPI004041FFDB